MYGVVDSNPNMVKLYHTFICGRTNSGTASIRPTSVHVNIPQITSRGRSGVYSLSKKIFILKIYGRQAVIVVDISQWLW